MKNNFLTILMSLFFLNSFGQQGVDCFSDVKKQHIEEINRLDLGKKWDSNLDSLNRNMTQTDFDSLKAINQRTFKRLTNCKYPSSILRTSENKEINTDKIKSNFIIINYNYFYCDNCIQQLEDFVSIKKEFKDQVTILIFFPEKQEDIQPIIDKYKDFLEFIPDMREYIEYHNLGAGIPLNLVLDKNKKVEYATTGASNVPGLIYGELKPYLK